MAVLVVGLVFSLFFALPISDIFWRISPLPKLIQFPWRFLALTAFTSAVLAGKFLPRWLAIVITAITVFFAPSFLQINRTFYPEGYYITNDDTTTVKNEYMPKWVKDIPLQRPETPKAVYFPGVKVIVDGQEVEPEIDSNGVVVTSGRVVFRETPIRLLANYLSILGFLVIIISWFSKIIGPSSLFEYFLGKKK